MTLVDTLSGIWNQLSSEFQKERKMVRLFLLTSFVLVMCLSVMAQDTPKAEVFGGYSYAGAGSNGFAVSVAGNLNKWFGIAGEIGGNYSRLTDQGFTEKIRTHSFLFGPIISLRKARRLTPFVHALFGISKLRTETNEFGPLLSFHDTSFGLELGGGLDIRINDKFAIRAVQLDYLRTNFFNESQNKGKISAGVVLRFGKK